MRVLIIPFLTSFGLSLALVPIARAIAVKVGAVAQPKQDRWHSRPTALFGGVAIALAVLICTVVFGVARTQPVFIACGALIFLLGLVDDIVSLRPSTKLVGQLAIASVFLFFRFRLGWFDSLTLDYLVTVLWIVGITNAFNLLDNMDGLCGGIALIAAAAYMINLSSAPDMFDYLAAVYPAILCGAVGGFLVYNVQPASIFMGDSGSLFLGLSLATLPLVRSDAYFSLTAASGAGNSLLPIVVAPIAVLLVPILDTTLVTISRILSGRSAAMGGRDHSSHRLVAMGLSERMAVTVLWAIACFAGVVGIAVRQAKQSWWSGLLAVGFLLGLMIFASFLARVRVYAEPGPSLGRRQIAPVVADLLYRRHVAEVLLDFCLVLIAYYGGYRLLFDDTRFAASFRVFLNSLPIVLAVQMVALYSVGAYRGAWDHFGLSDAVAFAKGTVAGVLGAQAVILVLYQFRGYSIAAFVLYGMLLFMMLTASRASFRLLSEFAHHYRRRGVRLVIYGAGDGGALAVRELLRRATAGYRMLGFIDDDPAKRRMRLHGYHVLGDYERLESLISRREVDTVVISARRFDPVKQRRLETLCRTHNIALLRLRMDLEPLVDQASAAPSPVAPAATPLRRV